MVLRCLSIAFLFLDLDLFQKHYFRLVLVFYWRLSSRIKRLIYKLFDNFFPRKGEETGRRLGDRFREDHRDVEKNDKDASKPVARHFILTIIFTSRLFGKLRISRTKVNLSNRRSKGSSYSLPYQRKLLIWLFSPCLFHITVFPLIA